MEVIGKIKVKGEVATFGAKGFKKQELVVTTSEQYPQDINIEFVQDKCDLLNSYNVGQSVKVSINLRGREWINPQGEAKYFNSVQGWRVEPHQEASEPGLPPAEPISNNNEPDDLPF
jgi:hypothetical protein